MRPHPARPDGAFYRGEIFAMAGANCEHDLISLNIGAELRQQFKDRRCEAYAGDLRVRIDQLGLYIVIAETVVVLARDHGARSSTHWKLRIGNWRLQI